MSFKTSLLFRSRPVGQYFLKNVKFRHNNALKPANTRQRYWRVLPFLAL